MRNRGDTLRRCGVEGEWIWARVRLRVSVGGRSEASDRRLVHHERESSHALFVQGLNAAEELRTKPEGPPHVAFEGHRMMHGPVKSTNPRAELDLQEEETTETQECTRGQNASHIRQSGLWLAP